MKSKLLKRTLLGNFNAQVMLFVGLMIVTNATYASSYVKGYIDGITRSGDSYYAWGWACQTGDNSSIKVFLYAGGAAGEGGSWFSTSTASKSSETGVASACGSTGTNHRFKALINKAKLELYAGKKLYVHGKSTIGSGDNLLNRSGVYTIPHPLPTMNFYWSPSTIVEGESTHRVWSSTNTDDCVGRDGVTSIGTSGTSLHKPQFANMTVTVTCSGPGGSISQTKTLTVNPPPNLAPTISSISNRTMDEGNYVNILPIASDPNEDNLTFSITNMPEWATFYPSSGRLKGTPSFTESGYYNNIKITVSDGDLTDSASFSITVNNVLDTAMLVLPESNTTLSNSLCFDWEPADGASHYTVQVSSDVNFNADSKRWVLRDVEGSDACWSTDFIANPTAGSTPQSLPNATYYWRIKSMDNETFGSPAPNATFTNYRSFTIDIPPPTLEFAWYPSTIISGETTHREWTTTNADYCIGDNGSTVDTSGVSLENVQTEGKTVTMTCHGPGGEISKTITLTVNPPLPDKVVNVQGPSEAEANTPFTISWDAMLNTDTYTVLVKSGAAGETVYQTIENVSGTSLDVSHDAEEVIIIRVQACNVTGCGPESGARIVSLLAPPQWAATTVAVGQNIVLQSVDAAIVECQAVSDPAVVVKIVAGVGTAYTVSETAINDWQCFDNQSNLVVEFSAPLNIVKLAKPINLREQDNDQ